MTITHYHSHQHVPLPENTPLFYTPAWLEALYPGEWGLLVAMEEEQLLALWSYRLSRTFGFRLLVMPPLTPYMGPWFSDAMPPERYGDVLIRMSADLPNHHMLSQQSFPGMLLPAAPPAWRQQPLATHILDLQATEEQLWKNCNDNTKRNIKKGQQRLSIRETTSTHALWHLKTLSYRNKGQKPPPHAIYLGRAANFLTASGQGQLLESVDQSGEVVGAILLVHDGHMAHYLYGAAHPEKGSGALAYLLWEGLRRARSQGMQQFNFEGSRIPGIARFFKGFGATETGYMLLEHVNHPVLRWWYRR